MSDILAHILRDSKTIILILMAASEIAAYCLSIKECDIEAKKPRLEKMVQHYNSICSRLIFNSMDRKLTSLAEKETQEKKGKTGGSKK